jgi:glycosyltransferase involved in cell wall biosynthesis
MNSGLITGIKNKLFLNTIGRIVDYIYKRCDRIFTSSESFIKAINKRGIPSEKIEFWPQYAEDCYVPMNRETVVIPEIIKDGAFNIIFAGNIGEAQGLDILPVTAKLLKENKKKIRFNIVGDGRYKEILIKLVNEYDVTDMFNFIDKQPAKRIPEFMAVCDAALICLSKSMIFSITLPAKTQSCLACGIPIIVSADGEIQEIIKKSHSGVCSDAGDAKMLAFKIKELADKTYIEMTEMARNGHDYSEMNFNKNILLDKMDIYLR